MQTEHVQTGSEGIACGASDQARVTENSVGAGGQDGGSTSGAESGEHGRGGDPGDGDEERNTYILWCRLCCLGDGGRY